jgi:hypothetical protein
LNKALGVWEPVAASGASAAAVAQVTAALDTRLRFDVCVFLLRETSGACLKNCNTSRSPVCKVCVLCLA